MDAYKSCPDSELALIQDIDEKKVREQAERLGVPWTTNFADLLAPDIDVVDVSTPNHLHAEQAITALDAGKHVMCQKPMAPTVAECTRMIEAAKRNNRQLGLYMSSLGAPLFYEVKEMIRQGFFGIISSVSSRGAHRGGYEAKDNSAWRGSAEKTGGGVFMQLAVHPINLFQWLFDDDIVQVAALSTNRLCKHSIGGDDLTHAVAEFSSGIYGTFEAGYAAEGGLLALYGTKGSLVMTAGQTYLWSELPWDGEIIKYTPKGGKEMTVLDPAEYGPRQAPLTARYDQHAAFVRAMREGKPAPVPGEIGRRDVAIVKAVYKSAEERRHVHVDEMM
jgi:predicted dehydrogenase